MVFDFDLNEDIVLPSLCLRPLHPKEVALHSLDVVWVVCGYLSATTSFLEVGFPFFIVLDSPCKGLAASSASISHWIRQTVVQAYAFKGGAPPLLFTAHSFRLISASWAF